MALSSCFCHPPRSLKIAPRVRDVGVDRKFAFSLGSTNAQHFGQRVDLTGSCFVGDWSFVGGSRISVRTKVLSNLINGRKLHGVQASWLGTSQLASSVFTWGTIAVLPFYTLMVLAPKAQLTKKCMESDIPYVVLGILYASLLYLSWTPDTLRYMFASKYMLPELPAIMKMFSSELTLASAWIHLLVVDLYAARQVFQDGLKNQVETRHSVSLCLLFCPIGIFSHFLTKALSGRTEDAGHHI